MGSIFDLLAEALVPVLRRRKSAEFNCSLRVIYGSQDGLRALFRSPAPPILVTVDTVETERQRRPNKNDGWWNVSVDSEIVELSTDTVTLEWGCAHDEVEVRVGAPAKF